MDKFVVKSNAADVAAFAKLVSTRKSKFKKASSVPLPASYVVNETAAALHPVKQEMRIREITEHSKDIKSYVLEPVNNSKPAYFRAGQYVSVKLEIGESVLSRPYSLSSSPKDALDGFYRITVKRTADGFASDYILDNWVLGTPVTLSAPDGTFCYEPLRDAKTVVALAGGSGITPFLSLAHAIADGTEDLNLILLYGCRDENDILFKDEFDAICASCDKIKVVYVLSESKTKGFEHGFITAKLIKKYAPQEYSIFVCGPADMYVFVKKEIEKLSLEKKYVRFELQSGAKPDCEKTETYSCRVCTYAGEREIPCRNDESILVALERAGINAPSMCRGGECGFCRSKLISGDVYISAENDGRRIADLKYGYIHPCCTYPKGDIVLGLLV